MPFNEDTWDRVIRILVGLAFVCGAWATWPVSTPMQSWPGLVSLLTLVIGVEFLITGLIGWSPMYALFGISTNKVRA